MTSIMELFPKCRKLAYDARQQVTTLQQKQQQQHDDGQQQQQQQQQLGSLSSSTTTTSSNRATKIGGFSSNSGGISEIEILLDELNIQLNCMDELVLRETPEQRTVWKRKIIDLRNDYQLLQRQLVQLQQYQQRQQQSSTYDNNRDELLSLRRRKKGATNSSDNNNNDIQNLAEEGTSLEQSQYMIFDVINQAETQYITLKEQRQRLHGVTGIVSNIADRLGITQTTMKIIERRDITDTYLVIVGIIITLLVLYFTWFY